VQCLEDVLAADLWAREQAKRVLTEFKHNKQRVGQV
jgi:hypothetical protein